jgi:hypothetical protein
MLLMTVFGALLALGVDLSAVRAGGMAVGTPVAAAAFPAGFSGDGACCGCCDQVPSADSGCLLLCTMVSAALLPRPAMATEIHIAESARRSIRPVRGATIAPDPHPPRSARMG